jgi:predicted transposase/invertase (TIGR01784 family)
VSRDYQRFARNLALDKNWLDLMYAKERSRKQGLEEGLEQGIEKGLEQGRTAEKLLIARNLLAEGSTPEFVQKITGLSLDEIER